MVFHSKICESPVSTQYHNYSVGLLEYANVKRRQPNERVGEWANGRKTALVCALLPLAHSPIPPFGRRSSTLAYLTEPSEYLWWHVLSPLRERKARVGTS